MAYEAEGLLHEMFSRQAKRTPEKIAVVSPDRRSLTFKELEEKTDLLAKTLRIKGVKPDTSVGIYMDKSIEYVIAYIAILKAGGAYLPIDTSYPHHLVKSILEDAEPVAVVTTHELKEEITGLTDAIVLGEGWETTLAEINSKGTDPGQWTNMTLDNLAYIVYSSGTTGRPKGILCPHRGAVFSYHWRHIHCPYSNDGEEREACNIFFVWEMLRPMLKGIPMYILPNQVIYDPQLFCRFLKDNKITRILLTPSLLETVINTPDVNLQDAFKTVRCILFCGEVVTTALFERCMKHFPSIEFQNLYSVSECHDVACDDLTALYKTKKDSLMVRKFAPVGHLLQGVHVVILDSNGKLQHVGEPGEIFVSGPTVAHGYLNRPELTAYRFIDRPDSVPVKFGDKLYRTGDWGYILSDGRLEICGRCDSMVKIRGYSIEVQAVEAALLSLAMVNACVVLVHGEEGTDKFLVAYLVPEGQTSKKEVRAALKMRLPFYMIPSYFVFLQSIPVVTATGKLDKKALPPFDLQDEEEVEVEGKPSTPTETKLAEIWANVLQIKDIDVQESFFDLGGHSLLAAELLNQLREKFQFPLAVKDLFTNPTVASLAQLLDLRLKRVQDTGESVTNTRLDLQAEVDRHDQGIMNIDMQLRAFWRTFHHGHHFNQGRVFLTGATGFLGAFILRELLLKTKLYIYALVRELPDVKPFDRIQQTLRQFGIISNNQEETTPEQRKVEQLLPERVKGIKGDVALMNLGMSEVDYTYMCTDIDIIIHAAASVNLAYPYSALHGPNVLGSANIILFASSGKVKPVHYISTDAVFPNGLKNCLEEDDVSSYHDKLVDGYSQSKWVAEQLISRARQRGLPVTVYRLGNMAGDRHNAYWNPQDFTLLILQACAKFGIAPDVDWAMEMTPVDFAAEVVVTLIQNPDSISKTYHIINTKALQARWVFEWMKAHSYPLKFVSFTDWRNSILHQFEENGKDQKNELLPRLLESYIRDESFFTGLSTYCNKNLQEILDRLGLSYAYIDSALLKVYFDRLSARNMIARKRRFTFSTVSLPLEDKIAVVTGASSGIGAAAAQALARAGAKVAMAARRLDKLKEQEAIIADNGGVAICVPTDVTKRDQVKELIHHAEVTLGPVDILVNCAGVMYYTMMKNLHEDEWERQIDINCKGVTNAIGAVLPGMLERGRGHIVNISSDAGRKGFPGLAVYSGTKFFVEGLSQALRHEVAGSGIRVTCIQPGDVKTELLSHSTDEEARAEFDGSSKCKILEAEDVAKAMVYAVSQPDYVGINEILIEPREAPV